MVSGVGLEPTRAKIAHRILSPMRLPIPPLRHIWLEAAGGFEPPYEGFAVLCLTRLGDAAIIILERETGFEPATFTLAT